MRVLATSTADVVAGVVSAWHALSQKHRLKDAEDKLLPVLTRRSDTRMVSAVDVPLAWVDAQPFARRSARACNSGTRRA